MKKLLSVLLVALLVAGLMTSALAGTADGKKIALLSLRSQQIPLWMLPKVQALP